MSDLKLAFELGKEWSNLQYAIGRENHKLGFPMGAETDEEREARCVLQDQARAMIEAYKSGVYAIEQAVSRVDGVQR